MNDYVSRYKLIFNDLASRGLLKTSRVAGQLTRSLARASAAAAAAGTAVVGAANLVNRATSERARLAESVQLSMETLAAFEPAAKGIGLNFENIVDLAEEMTNKIGEMRNLGEMTSLQEGLSGLKLRFEEIRDLKPDEQFNKIVAAAAELGDIQRASSALDQIFGGEASKLAGAYLATLDRLNLSHAEYQTRARSLNFLTESGTRGALQYNDAISQTTSFVTSLSREGFGLLGAAMAPVIEQFNEFVIANKAGISAGLTAGISSIAAAFAEIDFQEAADGVVTLAAGVGDVVTTVDSLIQSAGGIENVAKAFAGLFVVGKVGAFAASLTAISTLIGGPLVLGLGAAVVAGALIWENWDELSNKAGELLGSATEMFEGMDASGKASVIAATAMATGMIGQIAAVMTKYRAARLLFKGGLVIGVTFAAAEAYKQLEKFVESFAPESNGATAAAAITAAPSSFASTGDIAADLAAQEAAFERANAPAAPQELRVVIEGEIEGAQINTTRVIDEKGNVTTGVGETSPFERLRQRGLR